VTNDLQNYQNDLSAIQASVQGLVQHMQTVIDSLK
jgi:hypothetical protein